MAAPDPLYEGMFRQAGVIRVHSIEDLYGYGNMLALQPELTGRRIGILTNSGGPGSAMANALEKAGLDVPGFSEALQSKIRPLVYEHAPCGNPVDLTFHLDIDTLAHKIPAMILESGEVDGLVLHGALRKGYLTEIHEHIKEALNNAPVEALLKDFPAIPEQSLEIVSTHKMPVGISSFYDRDDDYTAAYQDHGIPVFDSPEKTAGAMAALYSHFKVRQRPPWHPPAVPSPPAAALDPIRECKALGQNNLDEYQSKCFLKAWGLPVNEEIRVQSGDEALQAAGTLGYPVVLKASSPDIRHKTGKGFIHLDLDSADAVADAYEKIQKAAGKQVPVLAGRMLRGQREFVAGIVDHHGFGPSVMFGFGGIFTEALDDVVFRPAPLSIEDAEEMIADIRSKKLLGEFRGMPAVNTKTLAEIIHTLSLIPLAHPEIGEIDINPLIVEEDKPVAVDALVVLKP
jgi:acetyltransferase